MSKQKNKDFYVWTMSECLKDTYENWGIDMMSMYSNIKKDFPNASKGIKKMYEDFNPKEYETAKPLIFKKPQFVYEAIANLVPATENCYYDIRTEEQSKEYRNLNICSWNDFVSINRMDLLMAVLLFTEEFVLWPISSQNVFYEENKLTVNGTFVILKISKDEEQTCISIMIKDVMLLEYLILD